jgi:hypothetical protein
MDAIRARRRGRTLSQYATDGTRTQAERAITVARTRMGDSAPAKVRLLANFVTNFFETRDLIGLGALASLDDVEFHLIAFLETLIALALDGAVVNEDVSPALAAEEAITLCVVEPLYGAFVLCQWSTPLFRV